MPTARTGYTVNGSKVPSVTTIIGVGLGGYSKDQLMAWAAKETREGRDYTQTRDHAASVGSVGHLLIEAFLNNAGPDLDGIDGETIAQAVPVLTAFRSWHDANDIEVIYQERQHVSKEHGFGGCFDALIRLDGVVTLADWKSGKGLYGSMVAQVGAYYQLVRENYPRHRWPKQAVIVRAGKDGGLQVVTLSVSDLNYGWMVFQAAHAVYKARYILDGMIKPKPVAVERATGTVTLSALAQITERV